MKCLVQHLQCSSHRHKAVIMWFKLTKRMTKPYCGTFCAHSSSRHKPTVLLNSCKTWPQPGRTIQQNKDLCSWILPELKPVWRRWMSLLCVLADGGLCGGFCSSWPGRLPIRSGFIRQCFNRGCSLHAPWHGHWNCKHVFTVRFVFCVYNPNRLTKLSHISELIYINSLYLQTSHSLDVYFMISVVLLNLHKPTVFHAPTQEQFI